MKAQSAELIGLPGAKPSHGKLMFDEVDVFSERYKLLSAALDLQHFTIEQLAKHVGVSKKAAENWVIRRAKDGLLTRFGSERGKGRGRRALVWKIESSARERAIQEAERLWGNIGGNLLSQSTRRPNLDAIKELDRADRLLDEAVSARHSEDQPSFIDRDFVDGGETTRARLLREGGDLWLRTAEALVFEWGKLGHFPKPETKLRLAAVAAGLRDDRTFEMRTSFDAQQLGQGRQPTCIAIADWIVTAVTRETRLALDRPWQDTERKDLTRVTISNCAKRLNYTLARHTLAGNFDGRLAHRIRIAVLVALARPQAMATRDHIDRGPVSAAIRDFAQLIGYGKIAYSIAASIALPQFWTIDPVENPIDIYAHVLAALAQHGELQSADDFRFATYQLYHSPGWNAVLAPLFFQIMSQEITFDHIGFARITTKSVQDFETAYEAHGITVGRHVFAAGIDFLMTYSQAIAPRPSEITDKIASYELPIGEASIQHEVETFAKLLMESAH